MPIDTGNSDVEVRWDNSLRYSLGMRMEGTNHEVANNPGSDETERKFGRYDIMLNRLDWVSELDVVYKRDYGFRISGAAWNDEAYDRHIDHYAGSSGAYQNDYYNSYTRRYILGPSAELLDAFVFGKIDMGDTTLRGKLGKHNVYWGESLYTIGNSIAYSQGPVDTIKAATSPGAEAKELFMPLNQVSGQWQLNDTLSVGGQYLLQWEPFRLVPGGTYFAVGASADQARADTAGPGTSTTPWNSDLEPERESGNFGLNARWSPNWLDGTFGLYYRKFDEKIPWSVTELKQNGVAGAQVRQIYPRDTNMVGASLTRNVGSVSVGSELSYRHDAALVMQNGYFVRTPTNRESTYDEAEGPRGNTLHWLVNAIWLVPSNSLWDGGTLQGEISGQHLISTTEHPERFYMEETPACVNSVGGTQQGDFRDGCATRDSFGATISFRPEWPQVLPGIDMAMPMVATYGIYGNTAALGGTNQGSYSWSVGAEFNYMKKYEFSLKYSDSHTDYNTTNGVMTTQNGSGAVQNNHGWLVGTFKVTF